MLANGESGCGLVATGQSSLGQFEDGQSPDQAAVASTTGGQEYTDPEAGTDSGQDDLPDVTLDPNSQTKEEFRADWEKAADVQKADAVRENMQADHPARKMVKEMAGPGAGLAVGTLVSMTGIGGLGLAGAALAGGASVAGSGALAFLAKETTDKGFRGGEVTDVAPVYVRYYDDSGEPHGFGTFPEYPEDEQIVCLIPPLELPGDYDFEEQFQDIVISHIMAQVRDLYFHMGEMPPEKYQIQGIGKLNIHGDGIGET